MDYIKDLAFCNYPEQYRDKIKTEKQHVFKL